MNSGGLRLACATLLLAGGCTERVANVPLPAPDSDVVLEVHARGFLAESFVGWGDDELASGGDVHLVLEDPDQVRRLLQALPTVCRDPIHVPEHPDLFVLIRHRKGGEIVRVDRYSRFEYLPGNIASACPLSVPERAAISAAIDAVSPPRD